MRPFFLYFCPMKKKPFIATFLMVAFISLVIVCVAINRNQDDQNLEYADNRLYYQNILTVPPIPQTLFFAGEPVPLDVYWVREALERELINQCYQHSRTLQSIQRAGRYFPIMKPILEKENVPNDFLYLCIAESNLENVVSPAKAAGFWQFMEATGKKYGLEISNEVDERYHLEKATQAACQYLKKCKNEWNSWTLAAAAYNMGENGLKTAINNQKSTQYWDLYLNTETARYVYRILAYKLIMENLEQYGIKVCKADIYHPIPYKEVVVDSSIENLYDYAISQQVSYRELKMLNAWLRSTKLTVAPNKTYRLQLPITPKQPFDELFKHIHNPHVLINNMMQDN